jgi:undecaprenyl pyrophosphate phosphatase UppP
MLTSLVSDIHLTSRRVSGALIVALGEPKERLAAQKHLQSNTQVSTVVVATVPGASRGTTFKKTIALLLIQKKEVAIDCLCEGEAQKTS